MSSRRGWYERRVARPVLADAPGVAIRVTVGLRRDAEERVSDPFDTIRRLADAREAADWAWRCEVLSLKAAGFSTRAIAQVAGVSHDTVWKIR
jgi:hypothetical protein